ncbi:MAG: hypothetical protein H0V17_13190 [Deltaproteobacteria bacterium]|nr:hypothetical protein [Deltaproteobacteria bacterium]
MRALLLAIVVFLVPSITVADVQKVETKQAKATVASVTAKRDKLLTVRDKLRELIAQPVPEKLSADHKKAYDNFIAAAKQTAADADAMAAKLSAGLKEKAPKLDSLSEMSELEAVRLQMFMDRQSKTISTLSNVLKKMSDTASQITQNLK